MKVKHLLISASVLGLVTLVACKKEDKEKQKTTAERIQAKWSIESLQIHQHVDNQDEDTTAGALTSDYFDIRSDNKIYASLYGNQDTLDYMIQNDSTLFIKDLGIVGDDGTYKIRNLTDNTMALYTKENDPNNTSDYIELQFNLKK